MSEPQIKSLIRWRYSRPAGLQPAGPNGAPASDKQPAPTATAISEISDSLSLSSDCLAPAKDPAKHKEHALKLVKKDGLVLANLSCADRNDPDLVTAAVNQNGLALEFASEEMKNNPTVVLTAVMNDSRALPFASAERRNDFFTVQAALADDFYGAETFPYIGHKLLQYEAAVKAFVTLRPEIYAQLDNQWKKNPKIMKLAMKDKDNFAQLPEAQRTDKAFVLSLIKNNPSFFPAIGHQLKQDPAFLVKAFSLNIAVYEHFTAAEKALLASKIPNFTERYHNVLAGLKKHDIEFASRFNSLATLEEIINNRASLAAADPRPLALIITGKWDYNQALDAIQLEELIAAGYRVVYFECGTEDEAYKAITAATLAVNKQAELLVWAAHGTQELVSLGEEEVEAVPREKVTIDLSDSAELQALLPEAVATNGTIVLASCSTGKGKAEAENIANTVKGAAPQANIYAAAENSSLPRYDIDSRAGKIFIEPRYPRNKDVYFIPASLSHSQAKAGLKQDS